MAVEVSTVPTALANLKTLLEADTTISTDKVLVTDFPIDNETEFVYIGDVEHEVGPAGIGAGAWPMEETYTITVTVSVVYQGRGEMDAAVSRAYTLAGRVETVIRQDRTGLTLNGAVREAIPGGLSLEKFGTARGERVEARVTVPINCKARRVTS